MEQRDPHRFKGLVSLPAEEIFRKAIARGDYFFQQRQMRDMSFVSQTRQHLR